MDRERKILENLNVSSDVSYDFKNAFLLFSQESNGNSMRMIERMIILNYSWSGKIIYIEIEEKFIRV